MTKERWSVETVRAAFDIVALDAHSLTAGFTEQLGAWRPARSRGASRNASTIWRDRSCLSERGAKFMKRTFAMILAALAAVALFGALVYTVVVAAHISQPAAVTVHGLTARRLWATTVLVLALVGVMMGGLALARPANRLWSADSGRFRAIVALVAGLIAVVNGALNLASPTVVPAAATG